LLYLNVGSEEKWTRMPGRQVFDDKGNLPDGFALKLIKQQLQNLVDYTISLKK
jgi:hypothetical protein